MTETTPPPVTPTPPRHVASNEGSGLAISSLVLGIMSVSGFMLFTGIPAIITGILALRKGQKERALSIVGLVLGSVGTFLSLLLILIIAIIAMIGQSATDMPHMDDTYFDNDNSMPIDSSRT